MAVLAKYVLSPSFFTAAKSLFTYYYTFLSFLFLSFLLSKNVDIFDKSVNIFIVFAYILYKTANNKLSILVDEYDLIRLSLCCKERFFACGCLSMYRAFRRTLLHQILHAFIAQNYFFGHTTLTYRR